MKKKIYLLLLVCFFSFSAFTNDGGEPYYRRIDIDSYEPTLNLKYKAIDDTLSYQEKDTKGKTKLIKQSVTSNIAIYDISKKSIHYLFRDKEKRQIVAFYYESAYQATEQKIVFNEDEEQNGEYYNYPFRMVNNNVIEKRNLSSNVIVITQDPVTNVRTVWIADKYGNSINKTLEFDYTWYTEIDVHNQQFRIYRQVGLELEVKDVNY